MVTDSSAGADFATHREVAGWGGEHRVERYQERHDEQIEQNRVAARADDDQPDAQEQQEGNAAGDR